MKLILIGILVFLSSVTGKSLKNVLKSPKETLKLYKDFKDAKHMHFLPSEERIRFKIFRDSANLVARLNEDQNEEAEYELNEFSLMTKEEKNGYLGVNASMAEESQEPEAPARVTRRREKRAVIPESRNYIEEGIVTPTTDQARCGSCWAFAAIVALEGGYKQTTGVLRKFSEQQLLDCTYDHQSYNFTYQGRKWYDFYRDGCNGGWYHWSFYYIQNEGHLASAADYPYHAHDCKCEDKLRRNALVAARVHDFTQVRPKTEEGVMEALSQRVLSVGFTVTDNFYPYKRGIWRDESCKDVGGPNHAVALVGYTPTYVLMKNSWGSGWGDQGYLRFKRNHPHCHLWRYAAVPFFEPTGEIDTLADDPASEYDPSLTDPHPDCEQFVNTRDDCSLNTCDEENKDGTYWQECKRTCNNCGHKGPYTGECPDGTTLCDGVCKHIHMC